MTARDRTGEPLQPALDDPEPDPEDDPVTDPDVARQHLAEMRASLAAGRKGSAA